MLITQISVFIENQPGKLGEVIQIIGTSGFNMESIKSRPMPHVPFEYYFYACRTPASGAARIPEF